MKTVQERVHDGAAVLDDYAPGWRGEIDLETLDIELSTSCVLGQVFGSYPDGYHELALRAGNYSWLEPEYRAAHGFSVSPAGSANELAAEWKAYLS